MEPGLVIPDWPAISGQDLMFRTGRVEPNTLTPRERAVLRLMSKGLTGPDIARVLDMSENTVRTHRSTALRKLGTHSAAHAVGVAIRTGIFP